MKGSTGIIIVSVVVAVLFLGGLLYFFAEPKPPVELPIVFEEFSDFQCPACGFYYPTVEEIRASYDEGELVFEYKHFPLEQIHARAFPASVASEAAREQGKFEEYYNTLFPNQENLEDEDLFKYAEDLGLDMEKFKDDYENNQELKDRVREDIADGESRGVNSTPSFYANGEKLYPANAENLKQLINDLVEEGRANSGLQTLEELE